MSILRLQERKAAKMLSKVLGSAIANATENDKADAVITVLEINGAVDFTGLYSLREEVFSAARAALLAPARRLRGRAGCGAAAARGPGTP